MEILSQCGQSTLQTFKPSSMNHGKGSVVGQLILVEYNRLTVSESVSIVLNPLMDTWRWWSTEIQLEDTYSL